MSWVDNKLAWNHSQYGGLENIRLPHDKVWKPVRTLIVILPFYGFIYFFK